MLLPRRKKKEKKKASPGLENQKKKEEAMLQKKEKRRQCYLLPRGEGKKKIKATWRAHVHVPMSIFVNKKKIHPHSIFSSFWKKTFWLARGGNTWTPPFIFLSSYPIKHTPKKFFFPFSFQNFPSTMFHLQTNTPLRCLYKRHLIRRKGENGNE